jgi:hypothetical protein
VTVSYCFMDVLLFRIWQFVVRDLAFQISEPAFPFRLLCVTCMFDEKYPCIVIGDSNPIYATDGSLKINQLGLSCGLMSYFESKVFAWQNDLFSLVY